MVRGWEILRTYGLLVRAVRIRIRVRVTVRIWIYVGSRTKREACRAGLGDFEDFGSFS